MKLWVLSDDDFAETKDHIEIAECTFPLQNKKMKGMDFLKEDKQKGTDLDESEFLPDLLITNIRLSQEQVM